MIDIHTHVIPFIDDGSSSIESSINMLKKSIEKGVTDIICTPHYRKGLYETKKSEILSNFEKLKLAAKKENLKINLYLGQEVRYNENTKNQLITNELLSINHTNYVLLEFSYKTNTDIAEVAYDYSIKGLIPIIAHVERYSYIKSIDQIMEIKASGGLIQVNASTVIGRSGLKAKSFVKKLIKHNLVDFIASDIHENREYNLKEAYIYITKKFGSLVADNLFNNNATKLITKEDIEIAS